MSPHQLAAVVAWPFLAAASALAQQALFAGAQYPMGGSPYAVALGDLDRDGRLDALTADNYPPPGAVTVARGDGRGGFGPPVRTTVGPGAQNVVLADLDGDQLLDAVATHDDGDGVSVPLGDGRGGWRSVAAFPTGGRPISVAVTDLDVDGDADIVTGTQFDLSGSGVAVLLGDGSGAFAPPMTLVMPNAFPGEIAVGHLNGDGRPDVVTVSITHVSVYFGDSGNLLRAPVHLPAAVFGGIPGIADLDEDGRQDLIVAGGANGAGQIGIYPGDGNGGFGPARVITVGVPILAALVQDMDRDGHTDVVVGDQEWAIHYLRGDGHGNLSLAQRFPAAWTLESLAAGDLTGDGSLDLVAASRNNNAITPILSNVPGRFEVVHTPIPSTSYTSAMTTFDVDRDGALDVVTADVGGLKIRRGDGSGAFAPPASVPASSLGALTPCDLDGDGRTDLVAVAPLALQAWRGDGSGGLASIGSFAVSEGARGVAVGDLDRDGKLDAVTVSAIDLYPRTISRMDVLRGDGAGGFGPASGRDVPHLVTGVALADLDGDGSLDIVTSHQSASSAIRVWFNDGMGGFAVPVTIPLATLPVALALDDLDGDGDVDIAASTRSLFGTGTFVVLDGDGNGGFAAPRSFAVGPRPFGLRLADVDGDGRTDAVMECAYLQVAILIGTGGGQFGAPSTYTCGAAVTTADVDADGRLDLLSLSQGVLVAFNRLPEPAGVAAYGVGTPGCHGILGTSVTGPPRVNAPTFAVVSTGVPPGAWGVLYLAVGAHVPGIDLFGIRFHVDLALPWVRLPAPTAATTAVLPLPIPDLAHLVGATVFAQPIWAFPAGGPCRPSLLGIGSGRGVRLTIGL